MTISEWRTHGKTNGARCLKRAEYAAYPPDQLAGVVTAVPLDRIDHHASNPRHGLRHIDELARSIQQHGLLQPLLVRPVGQRFEIIAGHRRFHAFQQLHAAEPKQWGSVPSIIRAADEDMAYLLLLAAQLHVQEWQPKEQGAALERLIAGGLTLTQIGEALSKSEAWASKRLRVLRDDVLAALVQTHALPVGTAEELLVVKDVDQRRALAERAIVEAWSQSDARAEARRLCRPPSLAALTAGRTFRQELRWLTPADVDDAAADLFASIGVELAQLLGARAASQSAAARPAERQQVAA